MIKETIPLPTPSDLTMLAFEQALDLLGTSAPAGVVLLCSPDDVQTANEIWEKHRSSICLVPNEILIGDGSGYSWAAIGHGKAVYSKIA